MTMDEAIRRVLSGEAKSRHVPDEEIDFSDIPEITEEQFRRMRPVRLGRPPLGERPRKAISIKLDPDLIARLKREAKRKKTKYQSLIHRILEQNVPA